MSVLTQSPPPPEEAKHAFAKRISKKLLEKRARSVLIGVVVVSIVLVFALIVVSVIISYLRQEVSAPNLDFNVSDTVMWADGNTICDPNGVSTGSYRLTFYNTGSSYAHSITISNSDSPDTLLTTLVVPQQVEITNSTYSYLLPNPGSYVINNFTNGKSVGTIEFSYPNSCVTVA